MGNLDLLYIYIYIYIYPSRATICSEAKIIYSNCMILVSNPEIVRVCDVPVCCELQIPCVLNNTSSDMSMISILLSYHKHSHRHGFIYNFQAFEHRDITSVIITCKKDIEGPLKLMLSSCSL